MAIDVVVGLMVAGAMGLALYGLSRAVRPEGGVEEQIEKWIQQPGEANGNAPARRRSLVSRVDRLIARRGFAESLATDLARADLSLTVAEYLALCLGLALAGFTIGYMVGRSSPFSVLLGLICAFLPQFYVSRRQATRLSMFNRQLPDVLERLVGSLRAGYGLSQAIEWVAKQMPNPAGGEFGRVVREMQLGRSLIQALDSMVRRLDSDDLALIVTAIQIHYEVGGSLADILETVAETIRERVRIQREIRVLTAQQRFSAYVLIALPIGLAVFLYIMNPEYEGKLFEPGPTLCIPIGAGIMMVAGYLIMRRLVQIEV
ncbi:MAG: type II secretion system F family protein [Anaerolineae bacterium]|nr:type II secretion system F family protein [Anaerolineae bacterium]